MDIEAVNRIDTKCKNFFGISLYTAGWCAKEHNAVSIISAGWDPGSDSIVRTLLEAILRKELLIQTLVRE